jgi:peptidyl-prolyl cis-trans isomerase SurA
MRYLSTYLWVLVLAAILPSIPVTVHGEVTDRIVAIVNDDIVTLREVEKFVAVEKKGRYSSMNEYLTSLMLREKVDTFVEALLITQQAKKFRIEVDSKEIDGAIENIKKQNLITETQLREQLEKDGISYKDFREGIRISIIRNRVLGRVIAQDVAVDDKTLEDYYRKNTSDFVNEEYKLQQIFISRQKQDGSQRAAEALARLNEGKSFGEVAREFSEDVSKDQNGDIGFAKKDDLLPELREAIKLLVTGGSYSRVVQTPYGFHILKLNEVKKEAAPSFDAIKDKVKEAVFQTESEKRYKEYVKKLRSVAYVEVKM